MRHQVLSVVLVSFVLVLSGCSGTQHVPAAPTTPAPIDPLAGANWKADATVVAVTGNPAACGSRLSVGQRLTGVGWAIVIAGNSISLDENPRNAPTDDMAYSGTLNGLQFSASITGDDTSGCSLRSATLSGSFSSDFSTFEAVETDVSGPPDAETTFELRWIGSRR